MDVWLHRMTAIDETG